MEDPKSLDPKQKREAEMRKSKEPLHRRLWFWIFILIIVVALGLWRQYQTNKAKQNRNAGPTLPVVLTTALSKDLPVYISALGNVTPTYTVTVRTQINGQLFQVLFKEGQMVKRGDVLAQIDPRPYLAQLTQYQGQLIRDTALLANARVDLNRYQKLWKQDSVAQQTLATQQSLVKQYEGAVKTDEGLLASTRLNLIYCRIISPIDGRIGLRLVDPGNFVQTSDTTGIAIVNMLNPITVVFTIPEDNVPQVMPKLYSNKTLQVEAYNRQQNELLAKGALLTVDNQIDTTTGTVKLKAKFENKENTLFPNQFVNIKLLVNIIKNATVVPTAAIQHSPNGDFVYLLNTNQRVDVRVITTGITVGEETEVKKGLMPGDAVVVEGADKLTNGAKVAIAKPNQIPATEFAHNERPRRLVL